MSIIGKVTLDLEARSAGWSKGLSDAGKDVSKFTRDAEHELKSLTFGFGANFNAAGLAKFGGAIAGISKHVAEMSTAFITGENVQKGFSDAINNIPIVGKFKEAGDAIRETITHEKALRVELDKTNESAQRVAESFRKINDNASLRGLHGDAREVREAEISGNEKVSGYNKQVEELQKKINEIKKQGLGAWTRVGKETGVLNLDDEGLSKGQRAEIKRLEDEQRTARIGTQTAGLTRDVELNEQRERLDDKLNEEIRRNILETDAFKASVEEKALRRQGKAIESAILAIKERTKAELSEAEASIRPQALKEKGFRDKSQEAAYIKSVKQKETGIQISGEESIRGLEQEDHRRRQEQALDNTEKLKEIEAKGNIERLQLQDETLNARYEKEGAAQRSHLADAAKADEEYRKTVVDLEKKYREEHRTWLVDKNDPTLKAAEDAAKMERDATKSLSAEKERNAQFKRQAELTKELGKAWEQAGDPLQKYMAHLQDIQEQFEKFHDAKLRDAQIGKLDAQTFEDLKKLNPDHETKVNLYGRTLDHDFVKSGGGGNDIARQQLEAIKKQAAQIERWDLYMRDIWEAARKAVAPLTEVGIGALIGGT